MILVSTCNVIHPIYKIYIYEFEGVCLTAVILAPGASEVGLGAAALAPLCPDMPMIGLPRANFARSLFVRRSVPKNNGNGRPF